MIPAISITAQRAFGVGEVLTDPDQKLVNQSEYFNTQLWLKNNDIDRTIFVDTNHISCANKNLI